MALCDCIFLPCIPDPIWYMIQAQDQKELIKWGSLQLPFFKYLVYNLSKIILTEGITCYILLHVLKSCPLPLFKWGETLHSTVKSQNECYNSLCLSQTDFKSDYQLDIICRDTVNVDLRNKF